MKAIFVKWIVVMIALLLCTSGEAHLSFSSEDGSNLNYFDEILSESDYSDSDEWNGDEDLENSPDFSDDEIEPEDTPEETEVLFPISKIEPWDYVAMRHYLGKGSSYVLTENQRLTLMFTNQEIADGGERTSLRDNWKNFRVWSTKFSFHTEEEAKKLDMSYYVFSSIEKAALQLANNEKLVGGSGDLRKKYDDLLETYRLKSSGKDARLIYEAIKGIFTDEEAIRRVLSGKSKGEIAILKRDFQNYLSMMESKEKSGKQITASGCPGYDSCLLQWLKDDLSGGWKEMIEDMYFVKPLKPIDVYFPLESAWKKMLSKVTESCKLTPFANGCRFVTGIQVAQVALNDAKEYYSEMITEYSDERSFFYYFGYFGVSVSTVMKSGTEILDPTATVFQIQSAATDLLSLLIGPAKLVKVGQRLAKAVVVAGKILANGVGKVMKIVKPIFEIRKIASSMGRSINKLSGLGSRLMKRATKFTKIADKGYGNQKKAAEIAAKEFEVSSKAASAAESSALQAQKGLAELGEVASDGKAISKALDKLQSRMKSARKQISEYSKRRPVLRESANGKSSTRCKLAKLIKDTEEDEDTGLDVGGCAKRCTDKFKMMSRTAAFNQGLQSQIVLKLSELKVGCVAACNAYFAKKTPALKQRVKDFFGMKLVKEGKWYRDIITRWRGALDYQIVYSHNELPDQLKSKKWAKFSCGHIV